jgi:hypothetical protein
VPGGTAPSHLRLGASSDKHRRIPADPQTGATEFTGVAPGHYELTQGDPPRIAELDADRQPAGGPQSRQTRRGSLRYPANLLRRRIAGQGVAEPRIAEGVPSAGTDFREISDGQFTFHSIPQGNWELTASTPEKQLPITSISIGNRTHPGNQLTVSDKPLQVVVTVSLSETRIEGFAKKTGVPGEAEKGASPASWSCWFQRI